MARRCGSRFHPFYFIAGLMLHSGFVAAIPLLILSFINLNITSESDSRYEASGPELTVGFSLMGAWVCFLFAAAIEKMVKGYDQPLFFEKILFLGLKESSFASIPAERRSLLDHPNPDATRDAALAEGSSDLAPVANPELQIDKNLRDRLRQPDGDLEAGLGGPGGP